MESLNYLFNNILTDATGSFGNLTVQSAVITLLSALLLGVVVSLVYYITQDDAVYQRSMAVTLLMLPMILSVIILFVGSNIARAFSLAGTLSIIRFRSAPGDPKDIGLIFFAIAAGLACGVGLYGYGILFALILAIVLIAIEKARVFEKKYEKKVLKITIPEDLNYSGAFDEILKKYTKKFVLTKIKTTDLGSLFELSYMVWMNANADEQEFLNELRVRNGNLNIILSVSSKK